MHAIGVRTRATAGAGVGARPSADAEPAARPAAATAEQAGQPAAELLEFWRATLGVPASADDDFFQLGGHSLQVLSLIDTVEGHTGRRLDVTEWLDRPTPRRMAELLGLRAAAPANPTAPPAGARATPPPTPAATPRPGGLAVLAEGTPEGRWLHLIPGAATGRLPYRELADALPDDWRITVQEDTGDTGDANPTVAAMADRHVARLTAAEGTPDVLAGWSMGGLLAHAVAARLEAAGAPCPPLLLLDPPAPEAVRRARPEDFLSFTESALRAAGAEALRPAVLSLGDSTEREARLLTALLRVAGARGAEARPDALSAHAALHRRHVAAMSGHVAAVRVAAPALLVAADLDEEGVDQWRARCGGGLSVVRLTTDHYGLLRGRPAREVARLADRLAALPGLPDAAQPAEEPQPLATR
ncbi:hypothetical protein EBN88_13040 [Streptomyces triticirhizae]|uniref:Carrier domain-containing protein n=1 Tax=Streptomyces triticirhizae TaxID=2483353 RepID=A0A3M2LS84_9ACTN|nr:hypothetical protein EBN88_13040 [Streptomyces triticirhizae]